MPEATNSGRFLVHRSSAGSGKTSTLVSTFLELALKDDDPKAYGRILAITFTNKAAREMKERVLKELRSLSDPESKLSPPSRELLDRLGLDRQKASERAGRTLSHILHNYSRLSVSTIDRFIHRVVQQFARDLRIASDFELVLEQEELLQRAVDLLITKAGGKEKELTEALIGFAGSKARQDQSWHIEKDILQAGWLLLDEQGRENWEELRRMGSSRIFQLRKELGKEKARFEQTLIRIANEGIQLIEKNGIQEAHFFKGKQGGIPSYFRKLAKLDPNDLEATPTTLKSIQEEKWLAGKCPPEEAEKIQKIVPRLVELVEEARDFIEAKVGHYRFISLVHDELFSLSVLSGVEESLQRIREEEDLLLISDLDRIIGRVVLQEPAPFIYERIGDRYDHILFDEFQDTSVLQWKNFLPLVENSLSEGNTVMLVGDGKQAIYRWRNGDVEQFLKLPELQLHGDEATTREREAVLKAQYHPASLNKNFRSAPEIVETNNALFPYLNRILLQGCEEVGLKELAELFREGEMEQEAQRTGAKGMVRFERIPQQTRAEKEEEDRMLQRCIQLVRDSLEKADAPDIAILTRKNAEGAKIAAALMEEGIKVLSSESLQLDQSPEVNFLVDLFRVIADPSDEMAKLSCMRILLEKEGRARKFQEAIAPFWNMEGKEGRLELEAFLRERAPEFRIRDARRKNLVRTAEEAIRAFGLDDPPTPYLQFFLDQLFVHAEQKGDEYRGFLDEWDRMKEKPSIKVPEQLDAVRVMTMHSAKGLQFPIVILPGIEGEIRYGRDRLWVDPNGMVPDLPTALVPPGKRLENCPSPFSEEERKESYRSRLDSLNLFYVAMTRAEDILHVLVEEGSENGDPKKRMNLALIRALEEWKGSFPEEGIRIGEAPPSLRKGEVAEEEPITEVPHEEWDERVKIRHRAPKQWGTEDPEAGQRMGELVHQLMSRIRSLSELSHCLEEMLHEGSFSLEEKEGLEEIVHRVLADEKIRPLFDPQAGEEVLVEQDLLGVDGSLLRPDRILIQGKRARLIDIKTGRKRDRHHRQLQDYRKAFEKMGYEVEALLLYTEGPDLVALDERLATSLRS